MKKSICILLSAVALFSSCKKDNEVEDIPVADIPVSEIKLKQTEGTLILGHTLTLEAEVLPANAADKTLQWKSSDESVATVNQGVVTGVSFGAAEITASSGGVSAIFRIDVVPDNYLRDGVLNIHIQTPGSLHTAAAHVAGDNPFEVLRLHGQINGNDLETLVSFTSLRELDLANADLVSGGTYALVDHVFGEEELGSFYQNVSQKFQNLTDLEKIVLPNTLKKIEQHAFSDALFKEVVLPEGLESIGQNAFYQCRELESINLPASLTSIGRWAFQYTILTGELVIPEGITVLESNSFSGTQITGVTLPSTLERLNEGCLYGTLLTDVTIPASVKAIEKTSLQVFQPITLRMESSVPPTVGLGALRYDPSNNRVYVPKGSLEAYQAVGNLSNFATIVEQD